MNARVLATAAFVLVSACGGDTSASFEPARRAVVVEISGCPLASDRTGSGVAVGDGLVVTVAHLVARAERVVATVAGHGAADAEVVAYDPELDLALLRLPDNGIPDVELAAGVSGGGAVVGGAASGTIAFEAARPVSISIEEVLGTERHSRRGYEIDTPTATGDSGAGAYDADGRLLGIVFAITKDGTSSWVTSSAEVAGFLEAGDSPFTRPGCPTP